MGDTPKNDALSVATTNLQQLVSTLTHNPTGAALLMAFMAMGILLVLAIAVLVWVMRNGEGRQQTRPHNAGITRGEGA